MERLEATAAALGGAGGRARAVVCDVRDPDAVEAMVTAAEQAFGPVNILVNNAGATFTVRAEDLSPNGFRAVVETDAFGTFYVCQAVGRRLIARGGGGAVLNITSTSPYTGNPGRVHGGVGKAGVESLTKSLAVEWGPYGIRVNSLAPGYTPTAGVDRATGVTDEAAVARRAAAVPLGRVGQLTDIVWPAVFLLSPAASYITGASLVVDGATWLSTGRAFDQTAAPGDETHGV
jgi:NAD(P)-dependent dehydrogenase (short-subunit alcohol dehydrogenase family)